ncbi:MAG TPA: hypothetical protein VF059_12215 [Casimicrobiaceae bacterium]
MKRPAAAWNLLLLAAFLAGAALRAWQIDSQVLIDDEWHAIHKLLGSGPLDILTHFGYADYSIPLTLYYQGLYRTIGLSEWGMHLPPLLAGIGLLLVGSRLLARWVSLPARAIWLALAALSPLLVYHSKVARPYALTSLLTFVAIVAFRSWWLTGRRGDAALYAVATFGAAWLHPVTLPFTLLPFVYYGAPALLRAEILARGGAAARGDRLRGPAACRSPGQPFRRLAVLAVATALPLALAILPPLVVDWGQLSGKAGKDAVTLESLYRTSLMLAGTGRLLVAAALWACAIVGFTRLLRRDRDLAWYLATVAGAGTVVVASSGAEWIFHPLVLARYLLPALPFVLLLSAEGAAAMLDLLRRPPAEALVAALLATGLLAAGPIPAEWHYPNQFWGHLRYQFDYDAAHNPYRRYARDDPIPAFYRELAKLPPGTVTLIEAPWRLESHFNAQSLYQDVHRQRIRIGLTTPLCGLRDYGEYPEEATGMRLREMVHLSSLLRGDTHGGDYLVLHRTPGRTASDPGKLWPDITACMPAIAERLGPPTYRDGQIVVYKLGGLSPLGNTRRPVQQ